MDNTLRLDDKNTWELNIPTGLKSPPRNGRDRTLLQAEQKKTNEILKKLSEEILSEPTSFRYSAVGEAFLDDVHQDYSIDSSLASWSSGPVQRRTSYRRPAQSQPSTSATTSDVSKGPDVVVGKRVSLPVKFTVEELNVLLQRGPLGSAITGSSQVQEQPTAAKKPEPNEGVVEQAMKSLSSMPLATDGQSIYVSADGKLYPVVVKGQKPGTVLQLPIVTQPSMSTVTSCSLPTTSPSSPNIESLHPGLQLVTMTSAASGLKRSGPVTLSIPISSASSCSVLNSKAGVRLPVITPRRIPTSAGVAGANYRPASLVPGVVEGSAVRCGLEKIVATPLNQQGFIQSGNQVIPLLPSNFVVTPASATPSELVNVPKVVRIDNVQPGVLRKLQTRSDMLPTLAELGPGARIIGQVSHQAMEAHLKSMTGLMKAEAVKTIALPLMYSPGVEAIAPAKGKMTAIPVGRLIPAASAGGRATETRKAKDPKVVSKNVPRGTPTGRHGSVKKVIAPTSTKRADKAGARAHPAVQKETLVPKKSLATLTLGLIEGKGVVVVPDEEGAEPRPLETKKSTTTVKTGQKRNLEVVASRDYMVCSQDRNLTSPMATVPVASPTSLESQVDISLASPAASVPEGPTPAPSPSLDQDFYCNPSEAIDALLKDEAIQDLLNYSSALVGVNRPTFDPDLIDEMINMDPSSLGFPEEGAEPTFTLNFGPLIKTYASQGRAQTAAPRMEELGDGGNADKQSDVEATMDIKDLIGSYLDTAGIDEASNGYVGEPGGTKRHASEIDATNSGLCTISAESAAKRARNAPVVVQLSDQFE